MSGRAGPVAVITGASSGIGRATAHVLAGEGFRLVLGGRRREALAEAVRECERLGVEAVAVVGDIADPATAEALAELAVRRFGRIDVWHNNAGVLALGRIDALPAEAFRRAVEIDVLGCLYGARAAIRRFRAQGRGLLIDTGSLLGVLAEPCGSAYVASKFAVRGLGMALRAELMGEPDIRVCTLLPIAADTPIFRRAANHAGLELRAIPPTLDPYRVAGAVLALTRRPRSERVVGWFGRLLLAGDMLTPGLLRTLIAAVGPALQFRPRPAPPTSGNLWAPAQDGWRVRGGWQRPGLRRAGLVLALAATALAAGALATRYRDREARRFA